MTTTPPTRSIIEGTRASLAGLRRGAAWAEWSIEPDEFIDAGHSVVIVIRMNAEGRGSGIEVQRQDALVYQIRDRMITRVVYYNNRKQALEAAGLPG
jgi:ketosteroid isomerase-like protein